VSGENLHTGGTLRTGAFSDDMSSHSASSVLFLTENNMAVVPHLPALPSSPMWLSAVPDITNPVAVSVLRLSWRLRLNHTY